MHKTINIFIGGDAPESNILSWNPSCALAADAGLALCKRWNIIPDIVLGDFDSCSVEEVRYFAPQAEIVTYSKDKNFSDSYLAIEYAYIHKYTDITLIGGIGKRLDHFIALLELFKQDNAPNRLIGPHYQLERLYATHDIDCRFIPNSYISFFPLSATTVQSSRGLRWDLSNIELGRDQHSLSNEYVEDSTTISMQRGALLGVWEHGNCPQMIQPK